MSKTQFWALNIIGILAALLILSNTTLAVFNQAWIAQNQKYQDELRGVPQLQSIAQNVITRIANESRQDEELRKLLEKYNMKVRYNND